MKEYLESSYEGGTTQFSILGCSFHDREAMELMHLKAERVVLKCGSRQEVEIEKRRGERGIEKWSRLASLLS